jgi:hypothetical protein
MESECTGETERHGKREYMQKSGREKWYNRKHTEKT